MNLFSDDIQVPCTVNEWERIFRPVNGDGGAQQLLRRIHTCAIAERTLLLDPMLVDKAYAYAYDYGQGGYEDRFRAVISAVSRTGLWSAEGIRRRARQKHSPTRPWGERG